jgi:hypothetical protein
MRNAIGELDQKVRRRLARFAHVIEDGDRVLVDDAGSRPGLLRKAAQERRVEAFRIGGQDGERASAGRVRDLRAGGGGNCEKRRGEGGGETADDRARCGWPRRLSAAGAIVSVSSHRAISGQGPPFVNLVGRDRRVPREISRDFDLPQRRFRRVSGILLSTHGKLNLAALS